MFKKENFHEQSKRSSPEASNESTCIRNDGGRGGGGYSCARRRRRSCAAGAEGPKRRLCARAVRRRVILVRGDRTIAGSGAQCHIRTKSSDDAARGGRLGRARAGAAGWSDGPG